MTRNDDRYIVALELSGTQVRGAAARIAQGAATPQIIAIETADKVCCMQYGRVQNLIDAAKHTSYIIQKLENNPALRNGKIVSVYVALAGRTLSTVKTNAKISLPTEMEMTEDLVRRLYQEATKVIAPSLTVLKVVPRKFIVDNHTVANPVGAMGSKLKGEFTIVVCSPVNRRNLELVMDERLNLPVAGYIVTPLAEAKMTLTEEEKQLGCVLVDFGAHTTTISIYKDRSLQYIVTLPLGSHNITRDLTSGLSLTEERAEYTKCTLGSAINEPSATPDATRVNCFLQARLGEIVANILAQIGFAGFKPADLPGGMIITGCGAKLKNFCKFVEQQSKMRIRPASVPATISVIAGIDSPADFLPLISIVGMVASRPNAPTCIDMPVAESEEDAVVDDEEVTADDSLSTTDETDDYGDNGYDDGDDDDDEDWDVDDDEAERRAAERRRNTEQRRKELLRKESQRRRERDDKRKREARKIKEDADLDIPADEIPEQKLSILERIKDKVANLFKPTGFEDDTDLDDEQ